VGIFPRKKMKICTFNVNSIRIRMDLISEWLDHRDQDLDILCLQELKAAEENFPFKEFDKMGFVCEVFGQKAYNGVAICSRLPLKDAQKGFMDVVWDDQRRFIGARLGNIHLFNIYAPHGGFRGEEKFEYKINWYDKLLSFFEASFSREDSLLLVGDFNVAIEDRDVYNPEILGGIIGTMPEEREAFDKIINWGFNDIFRTLHPESIQYTWWDYIGGAVWKNEGMRIDYALCTKSLLRRVETVEVDLWPRRRRTPKPSDHAPLIVTLDTEKKQA
jgi:exodeoxyribonuclease-3